MARGISRIGRALAVVIVVVTTLASAVAAEAATYTVGPITSVSSGCGGQNAEVEQAVDPRNPSYVYELWMGCNGIGFARSLNGGASFQAPISVPGASSSRNAWDPALTVATDGTVYASFMLQRAGQYFPVLDASFNHGLSFPQSTGLQPPAGRNWGDRDFIATDPRNPRTVYVTWDYGPSRATITYICAPNGSCAFATGELNAVIQKSTDGGRTFGPITDVSPGFPTSGGDSAPLVVAPDGTIDVLYQGYTYTDPATYTLGTAYSYFTKSSDGGATWSAPVAVGPQAGTMNTSEWWIDGDIARDSFGSLYATWDTQGTNADGSANDIGWLSYSLDGGAKWSAPQQVPADTANVPHIIEVTGGPPGTAYVGWLSTSNPAGYALYLQRFSVLSGLAPGGPVSVSQSLFGNPSVWPGDTFGISTLSPSSVALSWGSAVRPTVTTSEIFQTNVTIGP